MQIYFVFYVNDWGNISHCIILIWSLHFILLMRNWFQINFLNSFHLYKLRLSTMKNKFITKNINIFLINTEYLK